MRQQKTLFKVVREDLSEKVTIELSPSWVGESVHCGFAWSRMKQVRQVWNGERSDIWIHHHCMCSAKGNQSWIFFARTDAEGPILWPPVANYWLIGKDPDAGNDCRQEEKWMKNCWMSSPTWWTWVWASSRNWWLTRKPGMLQSLGLQRVRQDWVTELNCIDSFLCCAKAFKFN